MPKNLNMNLNSRSIHPSGVHIYHGHRRCRLTLLCAFLIQVLATIQLTEATKLQSSTPKSALVARALSSSPKAPASQNSASGSAKFDPAAAGVPTSYQNCVADPTNNALTSISLLSLDDGFALNNQNGLAGVKTASTTKSLTYNLVGSRSAYPWAYDLVSSEAGPNSVLAVFKNGSVGFVGNSSFGQSYVMDSDGDSYVTTIFALTCGSEILAGFGNGPQLFFTQQKGLVYAKKKTKQPSEKRQTGGESLRMIIYVGSGGGSGPSSDSRCPKSDQKSVEKENARPPGSNGCGSESFKVPDLVFRDCCNAHDLCYDDCSADFTNCNERFRACNLAACQSKYSKQNQSAERTGCNNLAKTYANAVSSPLGKHTFDTNDRCECKCKDDTKTLCSETCVDLKTDSQNCGSCGHVCPSGVSCVNGSCGERPNRCPNRDKMPECVASCGTPVSGCFNGYYYGDQLCNTVNDYGNCVCRATMTGGRACVYDNFDRFCGYKYGGMGPFNGTGCWSDNDCDCDSKCVRSDNCCGIGICAYGAGCTAETEQACL